MATAANQQQLSPQQRAINFATATRQTQQMLPAQNVQGEQSTVQFTLPKVRLLSKILLEVDAVATLKSTAASITKKVMSPYQVLRSISIDLNNGFRPFVVSGRDAYLYNINRLNPDVLNVQSNAKGINYVDNAASAAGTDGRVKFMVALPLTLNDRDPQGLILLQNEESQVTLTVDIARLQDAYVINAGTSDQVIFKSMTITPLVETFSIPPVKEAFPDISILKLVASKADSFAGNGQNIVKLNTGLIYRKLVMYFEDTDGNPIKDADFSGNLELIFNQADIPYSIKPSILSAKNHSDLGFVLPDGVYVFDFSNQGIPNLGGTRDYIDTEKLNEFWVRFNTVKSGKLTVVTETLSRLRQS
jgi:hypothetical protein